MEGNQSPDIPQAADSRAPELGRAGLGKAVALPRIQVVAQGKRPGFAEGTLEIGPGKLRIHGVHEKLSDQSSQSVHMTFKTL